MLGIIVAVIAWGTQIVLLAYSYGAIKQEVKDLRREMSNLTATVSKVYLRVNRTNDHSLE